MSLHVLFPHLRGFRLLSYRREADGLVLTCERVTRTALCPVCGTGARRIHSRYMRIVRDLSVQKAQVILHLHVRKFYCENRECQRCVFTERLPLVTSPHGRFTFGLRQFLGQLGREHGGASGAKSAVHSGIRVTPRAILRFMHALALAPISAPKIIGLDEWGATRRHRWSWKDSRKEDLPWGSCPTRLNHVRLGQWSRVREDGLEPVRRRGTCEHHAGRSEGEAWYGS